MFLVRAIYASKMSPQVRETDIAEILETSRRNNKKPEMTGLHHREFEGWSMGYVPESSLTRGILTTTFGPEGDFKPDLLGSQSALDFLRNVKAYIPMVTQ